MSSWMKPQKDAGKYDDKAAEECDPVDCMVCYAEVATYGISLDCKHLFCKDCLRMSMEAIMEMGQFPASCPMCRAEGKPEQGRISGPALSFLQQRGVITKEFQLRLLKQQNKALKVEEPDFFECPGKCGEFLLASHPAYAEQKIGEFYTDEASGNVCVKLGGCPTCKANVCVKCQCGVQSRGGEVPAHRCGDLIAGAAEADADTLAVMATIGKKCPVCGIFIEKNEGCEFMMCGTKSHGSLKESIKSGGCGIAFNWNTLTVVDDPCGWEDLDGSKKRGRPVTARQLFKSGKKHPKCARPECPFFKTTDGLGKGLTFHSAEGSQGKNNGGDYCCEGCKKGGAHSALCHQIRFSEQK